MAHRAYSRSAISVDKSQIPSKAGTFQKLNKYGIYQTRYWVVNNAYLAYWHSEKDHDSAKSKPHAAFDLTASEEVRGLTISPHSMKEPPLPWEVPFSHIPAAVLHNTILNMLNFVT